MFILNVFSHFYLLLPSLLNISPASDRSTLKFDLCKDYLMGRFLIRRQFFNVDSRLSLITVVS